ncbi:MAG TPA: SDR family NAD(P)-dependent oxidoreductase, partial [Xanthobacteraceae bacterium]
MIAMLDPRTLTVLITGATAGFGAALCRRFAEAGSRVIATGRRAERLDALGRELGDRCHVAVLDVRNRKAVEALVAGLPGAFAGINVAVANAGLALGLEPAQKADLDDWDDMVATNINGLLYTVRAVLPGM